VAARGWRRQGSSWAEFETQRLTDPKTAKTQTESGSERSKFAALEAELIGKLEGDRTL